ncbi:uncharacterized protein BXIN_0541 [Babesia sp. Xinjiang]|uniref:uncharacterized protein n=1 Tax=Babesia sp. Xinjiang TaxID=462227 RepID=UPI000A23AF4D|nr:uncharacterized protein BXIN_0541 [Babesia sp. Xinjiang]ORM41924.1 hypothetical protein BXIN_0541 [Babesia sp. Xinjiang]
MAKGAYTAISNDQARTVLTPALFSPQKPPPKAPKAKKTAPRTSITQPKSIANTYFNRSALSQDNSKDDTFAFMLDATEVARVKEASEALLSSLTSMESDYSDAQIVDTASLDKLQAERAAATFGDTSCIPLLHHPRGAAYAMLRVPPLSNFGPMINTRGVMALLLLELAPGKLFYESLNLTSKRRIPCPRQSHVLVLPDDVFKLSNESDSVEACVLMLSCRKDGKEFNIEQHVQGAFLTPVR